MHTSVLASFLAQAAAPPDPVTMQKIESVWDFVIKGGPTMGVIIFCSLVALTVIVERMIVLRRRAVAPADFVVALKALGPDRQRAIEYCRANNSPLANVLAAAIQRRGESRESIEKAVRDAGGREMIRLRARMRLLGALPQVATMLGLLGTIFGMIKTFQSVATSGQSLGKTEMLAKGIFEAWTNTAAGLLVAIPVLVAYHMLMGRIDSAAVALDKIATDWIEQERAAPQAPPQPAAHASLPAAARREPVEPPSSPRESLAHAPAPASASAA